MPDFKPDTYEYYVLLSADTTPDMLLKEGPLTHPYYTPNTSLMHPYYSPDAP